MSRTLLYGFAALALTALAWPADQALAISHGCTDPPDIKNLVIDVSLPGQQRQVSGPYCAAIQQAVALVDRSRMSPDAKVAAKKELSSLQAQVGQPVAGRVNWKLTGTCETTGNCTITGGVFSGTVSQTF